MRAAWGRRVPAPPIHHLLGLRPVTIGPAAVSFAMPTSPRLCSDAGVFHAGTAALMADAALAGAVQVTLPPGAMVATSDLSLNFLHPLDVGSGQLLARTRPIDVGNRLGLAESMIEDGRGRLVAHATTRCFVLRMTVPAAVGDLPEPEQPLAPCSELLGCHDPAAEEGMAALSLTATPWLASPAGTVYGGVLAFLADIVSTGAVATTLPPGTVCSPLDLKVQLARPVWPDGRRLRATATVAHRGRRFATAHAQIAGEDGAIVALAMSSVVIVEGHSWGSLAVGRSMEEVTHPVRRRPGTGRRQATRTPRRPAGRPPMVPWTSGSRLPRSQAGSLDLHYWKPGVLPGDEAAGHLDGPAAQRQLGAHGMLAQVDRALAFGLDQVSRQPHRDGAWWGTVPSPLDFGPQVQQAHLAALQLRPDLMRVDRPRRHLTAARLVPPGLLAHRCHLHRDMPRVWWLGQPLIRRPSATLLTGPVDP
jgi:uncharacterized protein (TIGR00369 family)